MPTDRLGFWGRDGERISLPGLDLRTFSCTVFPTVPFEPSGVLVLLVLRLFGFFGLDLFQLLVIRPDLLLGELGGELLGSHLVEELPELVDDLLLVHLFPFELDRRL